MLNCTIPVGGFISVNCAINVTPSIAQLMQMLLHANTILLYESKELAICTINDLKAHYSLYVVAESDEIMFAIKPFPY